MKGRFEALPVLINEESGLIEVTLKIQPVLEEDLRSHAYLEVINEVGTAKFQLTILRKKPDPIDDNPENPENQGIGIGVIIAISLACLIFAAALAGFTVWFLRTKQLLCFAQKG